jgi:glycosyltransferase involved in cell wall biosynthesis
MDAQTPPRIAVSLVAPLNGVTGIGAGARGTVQALAAAGVEVVETADIPMLRTNSPLAVSTSAREEDGGRPAWPVNLVQTNPDLLRMAITDGVSPFTPADRNRAFSIGVWAWETSTGVPADWALAYAMFDEIWAPSVHAAEAIARSAPIPVVVMPHVVAPPPPAADRQALGLPQETFVFLFVFDWLSNFERKNPAGLIAAYRRAFPAPSSRVMLVIKMREMREPDRAALVALAGDRADIRILEGDWAHEQIHSLIAACDAYVSLHRAEGFGLTLAEAMAYGKPVIATAYSGNMDFMSAETSYLAPYRLVRLAARVGAYAAGSVWAEPDIDAAAALMVEVESDRAGAAAKGRRAAEWVRQHLSAKAVGERMAARLGQHAAAGRGPRLTIAPR